MLLELVPESAPHVAVLAVRAYDIGVAVPERPLSRRRHLQAVPAGGGSLATALDELAPDPIEAEHTTLVGRNMRLDLGPYSLLTDAFVFPVLLPALDAQPPD